MSVDPHRIEHLARALDGGDAGPPLRFCGVLPDLWKLRPEPMHLLACCEPLTSGYHAGEHKNRLLETWPQRRRLTAIERVPERRGPSW